MATTLYPISAALDVPCIWSGGQLVTRLAGATTYYAYRLKTTRGASTDQSILASVAGPTNGINDAYGFISPPLAADVTISGSITFNAWAMEASMSSNAAINYRLMKVSGSTGAITQFHKTVRTTELGTSSAAANWSETPTSTSFVRGDRIVVFHFFDDAGTMAVAGNLTFYFSSPTAGVSGDSYVTFTETLTFESTTPSGTTVYPTTTAAGINPGSATEYEAWTSRGSGVATSTTNTTAGPTAGIQATATAGGTAIEWYTKTLTAVTLSGPVLVNLRGYQGVDNSGLSLRVELAVCGSDGSSPVVWGTNGGSANSTYYYVEPSTTEAACQFWVTGDDTSITDGQRIRVRVYIDDAPGAGVVSNTLSASSTGVIKYAGTSGGATGDTYFTFPVTLTEYSSGAVGDGMPYVGGGYYS